ncbi:MAG: hypothetical protein LBI05_06390 [Planctomycetaceae bacterium]|jgi:WD40 repeat protein|nr:hypothetical protein [Planctomycetaceae bacterium]
MKKILFACMLLLCPLLAWAQENRTVDPSKVINVSEAADAPPFIELKIELTKEGANDDYFFIGSGFFSPDGKKFVTERFVTGGHGYSPRLWDAESGKELQKLKGNYRFSPDGKKIAVINGNIIKICDFGSGKELRTLICPIRQSIGGTIVNFADFSPDWKKIVAIINSSTIRILDVDSGKELHCPEWYPDRISSAEFSSDGKKIVVASFDGTADIMDTDSTNSGHTARILDADSGKELQKMDVFFSRVRMRKMRETRLRVTAEGDEEKYVVVQEVPEHRIGSFSASFSPDGKKIVTDDGYRTVQIFEIGSKKKLRLEGHAGDFEFVGFFSDGKNVVTKGEDKTIRIWDINSGKELQKLEVFVGNVPMRKVWKARLRVTEEGNKEEYLVEKEEPEEIGADSFSVSLSLDGKKIVAVVASRTVQIFEPGSQKNLRLEGRFPDISPDGKKIATIGEDNSVLIRDTDTGKELHRLEGHTNIRIVTFSPDGTKIATSSGDGTTRIWTLDVSGI